MLSNQQNQIFYLSPTEAGSIPDKALANAMDWGFLPQQNLLLDLGFIGYQLQGAQTIVPFKKPQQAELSEYDQLINRLLASIRVKVEHVIAGAKRIRMVKDKIRLRGEHIRD